MADTYFSDVVLLLHGEGSDGSSAFYDSSGFAAPITAVGPAQLSAATSRFGATSMLFDGRSSYLSAPASTNYQFDSLDFTLEGWVFPLSYGAGSNSAKSTVMSTAGGYSLSGNTNGTFKVFLDANGVVRVEIGPRGGYNNFAIGSTLKAPLVQWTHVAVSRVGSNISLYVNGVFSGKINVLGTPLHVADSYPLLIGASRSYEDPFAVGDFFDGYIDELRITPLIGRYTAGFIPPVLAFDGRIPDASFASVSLLLHCEGADNGKVFTDASLYPKTVTAVSSAQTNVIWQKFGGTGAYLPQGGYLTVPNSPDFDFGTGDFTIETWFYVLTAAQVNPLIACGGDAGGVHSFGLTVSSGVASVYASSGGTTQTCSSTLGAVTSGWHHYAGVRSGSQLIIFVDGAIAGTLAIGSLAVTTPTSQLMLGHSTLGYSGEKSANGVLDEVRISKGLARYTAAFTVATAEFGGAAAATIAQPRATLLAFSPGISIADLATRASYANAFGGGTANASLPANFTSSVSATGSFPAGSSSLTSPISLLRATGSVSGTNTAAMLMPVPSLYGFGAWPVADFPFVFVNLKSPSATLTAVGGSSVSVTLPSATVSGNFGAQVALVPPSAVASGAGRPSGFVDISMPVGVLTIFPGSAANLSMPAVAGEGVGHDRTGENSFSGSSLGALSGFGGATANLAMAVPSLGVSGVFVGSGAANLRAPSGQLDSAGTTSATGWADLAFTLPFTVLGFSGAAGAVTLGSPTLSAAGTSGGLGLASIVMPLFELVAAGTQGSKGSADLLMPAAQLGSLGVAWLVSPGAKLTAVGSAAVAVAYEAYSVNLSHVPKVGDNMAPIDETTRYTNFPFERIVRYQNSYFGVAADGLYLLAGTTDNGSPIPYAVKTAVDDFGGTEKKTVASAYLGGRVGPSTTITLFAGETGQETYPFTTPRGQDAQNHRQRFGRGVKHRYFALGLSGVDALELDDIELDINKLTRRI